MKSLSDFIIRLYPYAITGGFVICLLIALYRYFTCAFSASAANAHLRILPDGKVAKNRKRRQSFGKIALTVLAAFLLSRAAIWLIGYIGYCVKGNDGAYLFSQRFIWNQWDAPHYLGIAQNGYVTEGDARLHIVFYPLYPMLVRLTSAVITDPLIAACVVSNLLLIAAGFVLYRLTEMSYGRRSAVRAVWLLMFCPGAVFYSIPYTESLFLLLTLLCVYFARLRRFTPALLAGALSAFTRMPGIVAAAPVFLEMLLARKEETDAIENKKDRALRQLEITTGAFAKCLFILTGFFAYLIVNKIITGNALTFLDYQKNHWLQSMGSIFNTAEYSIRYLFTPNVEWYRWGVWIPQCISLMLVLIVMLLCIRKSHPGDLSYSLIYYFVTVCPTMLISGTRYLSTMYCLFPMLAILCRSRIGKAAVGIVYAVLFVYCTWMYTVEHIFL